MPWFKLSIFYAIAASGAAAFLLSVFLQGQTFLSTLVACFAGYVPPSKALGAVLSGGGILSMLSVILVVFISSTYSGIFNGTGILKPIQEKLGRLAGKIGLFPTQIVTSVFAAGVFCNQTVGTILSAQMLGNVYEEKGAPKIELAADIGSSIITIAGLIPWSIAATVPLTMMGVGSAALLFSVFLYAVPLCYLITRKIWF
jgi:NhaC family Na+:H+ antiporter